jgi:calcium-dependent protein kinase
MVFHLSTEEEMEYMQKTFKAIDLDGNGKISKNELLKGYIRLYQPKLTEEDVREEVDLIWEQIDVDGSGEIDYSEWALAAANKEKLLTDKRL